MKLVKTALTFVAIFGVGALTSVSCFEAEFENPSFRCKPVVEPNDPPGPRCPEEEVCCSDDPAATKGRLPNYYESDKTDDTYGVPIFSGANNSLSSSGMCVSLAGVDSVLVNGCPVPCNPTWDEGQRNAICRGAQCCQMQELDPVKDCVMDLETKKWRPVNGGDIPSLTKWGPAHTTNQDPVGAQCMVFAAGSGTVDKAVVADCFAQLTVANQRGFCYKSCPCIEDVCDQKNPGFVPKCGAVVPPATMM